MISAASAGFGGKIVPRMYAAPRRYGHYYGGTPGNGLLRKDFVSAVNECGLTSQHIERIFFENPSTAYHFVSASSA